MTVAPSIPGATIGASLTTAGLPSVSVPASSQRGIAAQGAQGSDRVQGPQGCAVTPQERWRSMLASAGVSTGPDPALRSPVGADASMPARSALEANLQHASSGVADPVAVIRSSAEADAQRVQVDRGVSKHAKRDKQRVRGHEKKPIDRASTAVAVAHPQEMTPAVAPPAMPVVSSGLPLPATVGLSAKGEACHSSAGLQLSAGLSMPNEMSDERIGPSGAGHLAWASGTVGRREAVLPGTGHFALPLDPGPAPMRSPVATGKTGASAEAPGVEGSPAGEGVRPVLAPPQQAPAASAALLGREDQLPASPWIAQGTKTAADQTEISPATTAWQNAAGGSQVLTTGDFTKDPANYAAGRKSGGTVAPVLKSRRPNSAASQEPAVATAHSVGPVAAAATASPMGHGPMTLTLETGRGTGATVTSGSVAPPSVHEMFAALDQGAGAAGVSWTRASSRQAEAGYQDPALGWVSVRAQSNMDGIHAALVPGSADAAQSLSGHLAGLNAYLSERQTQVESLHVAPPENHWGGQGTGQGAGQAMSQSGGESHGQSPRQQSNQNVYAERESVATAPPHAVGGAVSAPRSQTGSRLEAQAGFAAGGGTYVSVMA